MKIFLQSVLSLSCRSIGGGCGSCPSFSREAYIAQLRDGFMTLCCPKHQEAEIRSRTSCGVSKKSSADNSSALDFLERSILPQLKRLIGVYPADYAAEYRKASHQHYRDNNIHLDIVAGVSPHNERRHLIRRVVHGAEHVYE